MSENQTDTETEKLRAFEKKMHDEGAAGFADGPSPWETWDDETGLDGNKRVWEGKSRRIYPKQQPQQSLGDRVLSGLAMLSLATMVVGIAGVYFSDRQPRLTLASGVQPLPIDRTPVAEHNTVAALEQLPSPASGSMETAKPASGNDRNDSAPLAGPETMTATTAAPAASDSTLQTPELPVVTAAIPASASEDSASEPAMHSGPAGEPPHASADNTADAAGNSVTDATDGMTTQDTARDIPVPAPAAFGAGTEPVSPMPALAAAPVTVTVTVTTGNAANLNPGNLATTAADTPAESGTEAAMTAAQAATGSRPLADTVDAVANSTAASTGLLPGPAPLPGPVAAPAPVTAIETGPAAEVIAPSGPPAATRSTGPTASDPAETVASLEVLPATSAGATPANAPVIPPTDATDTVVAAAEPAMQIVPAAPTKDAEQAVATVKTGDWVVNLASYTRKSTARRMLEEFRDKGVDAELVSVMINDAPMHRIRVAGFANSRAAKASIGTLEQQLDLDGIWISRK